MQSLVSRLSSAQTTIFTEVTAKSNQYHAINLGQGFPDYNPPDGLLQLVGSKIKESHHQYAPMPGVIALRQAIGKKMDVKYGVQLDPDEEITVTAGATQAILTAIMALIQPGDEVILFEPAYDSYRPSVELAGGKVRSVLLERGDFRIPWQWVRASINDRTKLIIVNTPHNPSGTTLDKEDVEILSSIVSGTDIRILSDEVYEHLVYDGREHSCLLSHPVIRDRCLAVFSFGKTFHCTGWKVGYCAGPAWLMREFRKMHQWSVFSVNSFLQAAFAEYINDESHYAYLPSFYQQKRDFFREQLEGTGLTPLSCDGTFFQVVDYSAVSDLPDTVFIDTMIREVGVAAIPLSVFSAEGHQNESLIRFCFAKTEETLAEAGKRLKKLR
jgi:methionine aminotransferase